MPSFTIGFEAPGTAGRASCLLLVALILLEIVPDLRRRGISQQARASHYFQGVKVQGAILSAIDILSF